MYLFTRAAPREAPTRETADKDLAGSRLSRPARKRTTECDVTLQRPVERDGFMILQLDLGVDALPGGLRWSGVLLSAFLSRA